MYSQDDLISIRTQQRNRWLLLLIPAVILLTGIIISFIYRIEWITTSLSIILGCMILFTYEMHIKPLKCYQTHLEGCLNGRTHEMEATFITFEDDDSLIDGVRYRGMLVYDDTAEKDFERLFYCDLEKPLPDVKEGDHLRIVYHDRELVDIAVI